jgi:hypothetical protein
VRKFTTLFLFICFLLSACTSPAVSPTPTSIFTATSIPLPTATPHQTSTVTPEPTPTPDPMAGTTTVDVNGNQYKYVVDGDNLTVYDDQLAIVLPDPETNLYNFNGTSYRWDKEAGALVEVVPTPEVKSSFETLTTLVENALQQREYEIRNGNEVYRNGQLIERWEIGKKPILTQQYGDKRFLWYIGARYLGNSFTVDWHDPEFGPVKLYGFEAAFYNPAAKEWAAVPVLWTTSGSGNSTAKYREAQGTKVVRGTVEEVNKWFNYGESLHIKLEAGDNTEYYKSIKPVCYPDSGVCNYFTLILTRAFGSSMYPAELLSWIGGEETAKNPIAQDRFCKFQSVSFVNCRTLKS